MTVELGPPVHRGRDSGLQLVNIAPEIPALMLDVFYDFV
jgi:hypothetical protein